MKVLVINAGSSSLKYQLMDMTTESVLAKGLCERIGIDGRIVHKTADGKKYEHDAAFPTHKEAFEELIKMLTTGETKVINDIKEIEAVGQRAVHGGELFKSSVVITDDVLAKYEALSALAPLHNPAGVQAMKACASVFGKDLPQVAVFDTSFHQTMPAKAYMYGIPYEYYEKHHVRRYGFHGTSHRYVSQKFLDVTGMPVKGSKIITCHLGNGGSITAIKDGESVDTTMGFTPLDGIMMGTRCGAIDPSIVTFLMEKENLSPKDMDNVMNKKSGLLGISGVSNDFRDIGDAASKGDARANLALDMYSYQIKKFIGGYAAAMGGVDAILFTGGIGENGKRCRQNVCEGMEFLGLKVSEELNAQASGKLMKFSTDDSKVQAWVVPTDEELLIARDTCQIVSKK